MAKAKITPVLPPLVSCDGCIYNMGDNGGVMWCDKIKMPQSSTKKNHCIYKIKTK